MGQSPGMLRVRSSERRVEHHDSRPDLRAGTAADDRMDPSILIFDTAQQAAEACGDQTLAILDQACRDRGTATLAVSGGSTPRLMFQAMATRSFDWSNVLLCQVDERCVPPDNRLSNYRMMRESLLEAVRMDESRICRIKRGIASRRGSPRLCGRYPADVPAGPGRAAC